MEQPNHTMIIVHHLQLWFYAETKFGWRHKPQFPGVPVQAAQHRDERSEYMNNKDPFGRKAMFRSLPLAACYTMLSIVKIQPGVTIFFKMSLCCSGVVLVVLLCCCIWPLPFPPTWNLIRSWWEMKCKMDKQCCYLVRNALRNRGNPTFPYEDNFSNKTLSKYAGPSHKGSLTWARQNSKVCVVNGHSSIYIKGV